MYSIIQSCNRIPYDVFIELIMIQVDTCYTKLYTNIRKQLSISIFNTDITYLTEKIKHPFKSIQRISIHTFFSISIIFVLFSIPTFCNAVINIASITTTISTCSNNGTATINATSTKSPSTLMYEIVAGPNTAAIQNNSTFSSLFPGTYTVRVYDTDFASKDQQFTITGDYELPDLTPHPINPSCPGSTDGKIIGNAVAGKGKAPFTWEIVYPTSTAPQVSDVFDNLESGTYTIKMTDACGNFQSRTSILVAGGTGLSVGSYDPGPYTYKFGCDSVSYTWQVYILKEKAKQPFTLTLQKADGSKITSTVYPIPLDTIYNSPGIYTIRDTIANVSYGDFLYGCLTDPCGYTICANKTTISPFVFEWQFKTTASCGNKLAADVRLKWDQWTQYMAVSFKAPLTLTLHDVAANTLVDSIACDNPGCPLSIKEQTSGRSYRLKIVDGCGQIFQQTIMWPVRAAPIVNPYPATGCMDSTAVINFNLQNFTSAITVELLSGPTKVGSTKPGYEFSDHITYPKKFNVDLNYGASIKNLPIGTYTYSVYDTCGNKVNGSFEVLPFHIADFNYSYSIKKGCLGDNILYFNPESANTAGVYIIDATTNEELYYRRTSITADALTSLKPGKYILKIYYGYIPNVGGAYYNGSITDGSDDCWALTDTITIPPYSNNTFKSNVSIFCNGTSYVEINVDSTRGVPPYQYEISSGPQTFPLQNNNTFQLPTYGNYVIRIRDACGNSNTRQISVDSAKFPSIIKKGAACTGGKIILKGVTSKYFEYQWQKPNGIVYTGDSLVIHPLGPADTGTYIITKKVTINGCTDTFKSTYHVQLHDVMTQTIPFCAGTPIHIGTHIYKTPGIYTDTLKNELGCDSIITTTLKKLPQKIDSSKVNICKGEHITLGTNTYTTTGIYKDSIQNVFGCYDLKVVSLYVHGIPDTIKISLCTGLSLTVGTHTYTTTGIYTDTLISSLGCDSIVVHDLNITPYTEYPVSKTICEGQSFTFLTKVYTKAGVYRDTIAAFPCKSVFVVTLTVDPYKKDSIVKTICEGQSYTTGDRTYTKTGIYRDTVSTLACDSITIVNLTVTPLKRYTLTRSICQGQSISVGIHTYTQTGIYQDTLATVSCDSIVTLNLTVQPYKRNTIAKTICTGETFTVGIHTYSQTGTYSDTLATASCDSIVKLVLTVKPLPALSLGKDTSLCMGQSLLLNAGNGYVAYYWNDALPASTQTISASSIGTYWVKVKDQHGCSGSDTIKILNVYPLPVADAGQNITACYGVNTQLSATGGIRYLWQPGNLSQAAIEVTPTSTSTYSVTVYDANQCSGTDNILVTVYPKPTALLSATSMEHCFEDGPLTLTASWGQSFIWSPSNEITQSIQALTEGIYTVRATDVNNCSVSEQIALKNICDTRIFVPTGFSPNADGLHDDLEIFGKNFTAFKITIFNRWGEIIFISTEREVRWNGMYRGEEMPIGSYPWVISYQSIYDSEHKEQIIKGSITLVR